MTTLALAQRVLAIHAALSEISHAFGGALALAYYAEPRATVDIDVNIFVPKDAYDQVAAQLTPLGMPADADEVRSLMERDGQARILWDDVPVDVFLSYD